MASIWTLLGGDLAVERALLALVLDDVCNATHEPLLICCVQRGFPMRGRAVQRAATKFARKLAMRVEDEVNHCWRMQNNDETEARLREFIPQRSVAARVRDHAT